MRTILLLTAGLLPVLAQAQSTQAKITQVTVYPGMAKVERQLHIGAGDKEITIPCLSAMFDTDSLRVQADNGIRFGDIRVQNIPVERAPECADSPQNKRIRELEEQIAAGNAEIQAGNIALDYLRRFPGDKNAAAPLTAVEPLRRQSQDLLNKQAQTERRLSLLNKELANLTAERDEQSGNVREVRSVSIRVSAAQEGNLQLQYMVPGAGWTPVYRATLDTRNGNLRFDKHAQVSQRSGEEWQQVNLVLSTTQPNQFNRLPFASAWQLDLRQPEPVYAMPKPVPIPSPVMAAKAVSVTGSRRTAEADFDISVFQGAFSAEYKVPGKVSLPSDGRKLSYALEQVQQTAEVLTRILPAQNNGAWLLARFDRPAGSWPQGQLQLYRDQEYISQMPLNFGTEDKVELPFGKDEKILVSVTPTRKDAEDKGFTGSRQQQTLKHAYRITNQHQQPRVIQVLEATPVALHQDIKVEKQVTPAFTETDWNKQAGVSVWKFTLAPGQSSDLQASYQISFPKEPGITGLR
ncbi:mucoidy inhibitor MuiA family protein [Undibacterium luofuense]|mgnify:CR=1 FL=1|uniref:mucoidy inhibitor MuiA family protein n=1 Tax=Undibacterium luofuense TaxID=2828733 RepID=UPI0030EC68D0